MEFRSDINGLRAMAVLLVLFFHFNVPLISGGFVGVDVFFVISGYLMTGIIFTKLDAGKFSFIDFYLARGKRIVPPLFILLLFLSVWGYFYLFSIDYRELGKYIVASALFISNLILSSNVDYFADSASGNWLLHTWSLSVEWQFYIVYPVIIFFIISRVNVDRKIILLLLSFFAFLYSVYCSIYHPSEAYFSLLTRCWEMLIGGWAFLISQKTNTTIGTRKSKYTHYSGLLMVFLSSVLISKEDLWPGYLSLLPVCGTLLILISRYNKGILSFRIFQKIGSASYSIYLWHWPFSVYIYYNPRFEDVRYLFILFSILIGFLSYGFVENRLSYAFLKFKNKNISSIVYIIISSIIGFTLYFSDGLSDNYRPITSSEENKYLKEYEEQHNNLYDYYNLKCDMYDAIYLKGNLGIEKSCYSNKHSSKGGVFLWGDSHAEALSYGLRSYIKSDFYQVTSANCKPSLGGDFSNSGNIKTACNYSNELAIESIANLKPYLVILAQARSHNENDWHKIAKQLKKLGVTKVVLVGPVPQWLPTLPRVMVRKANWKTSEKYINDPGLVNSIFDLNSNLEIMLSDSDMEYISLTDELCYFDTEIKKYKCRVKDEYNNLLQVDYGHLSKFGSLFIVGNNLKKLVDHINEKVKI